MLQRRRADERVDGLGTAVRREIFWRETEPVDPGPPLEDEVHCDLAVVGGGYTGLWTAHMLKRDEPSLDIQIVESEFAGAGASGHNDGFITPTIGHSLHTVVKRFGAERAKAAYVAVGRSILEVRRFCRKQGIDAEIQPGGFFFVATSKGQMRRLESDVELAARMGVKYEVLDPDTARERIGSSIIVGALKTPGALVNPHRLVRGLARVVREQGVGIHEQTPALAIGRDGAKHVVTTPRGRLVADRLLLATNAYQHQWRAHRDAVKPVWSYVVVSEPLTEDQLARVHWPDREGFVEARNFITFGRLTADNRLLFGGGPAPYYYGRDMSAHHVLNPNEQSLAAEAERWFPQWSDVRWSHSYGGCIAVTRDLVPHVGRSADGVFYAYGYCGNGIAMTHCASKSLRDLILERDTEAAQLPFVRDRHPAFPPEPLAFSAARLTSAVLAFQDRHPQVLQRQFM